MSIYVNKDKATLYKGNYCPAELYKGSKKIAGYTPKTFSGQNIAMSGTYNDTPSKILIKGGFVPSKNLFNPSWMISSLNSSYIELSDDTLVLKGYACPTYITPEKFLELTGLCEGDTVTASHTKEAVSGETNTISGRILFYLQGSSSSGFVLTANGNKKSSVIPENFNSENYQPMMIYGCKEADENGSQIMNITNLMISKDADAEYEPYHDPAFPVLTWNNEEITIPYVLCEGDYILYENGNVVMFKDNKTVSLSDTQTGQIISSLKIMPLSTSVSVSEGEIEICVKISI